VGRRPDPGLIGNVESGLKGFHTSVDKRADGGTIGGRTVDQFTDDENLLPGRLGGLMGFLEVSEDVIDDGVRVLRVSGDVDFDVAPELKQRIVGRVEAGDRKLIIDLSAVGFIDSTAIGVLVAALKRLRDAGGTLMVVCDNEDVRSIFATVGLESVIPLHRSDEDAFAALAHAR
jgi:anti-sigma B factor antagonist